MEIIITILIVLAAVFIFVGNLKKKAKSGGCDCGSCSSHCPSYKDMKSK